MIEIRTPRPRDYSSLKYSKSVLQKRAFQTLTTIFCGGTLDILALLIMAAYSSFFSSGLLAPPVTIYSRKDLNVGFDDEDMVDASFRMDFSPAAPSSPMAVPDEGDVETELNFFDRAATPTPEPRSRTLSFENMSNYELPPVKSGMETTGDRFGYVSAGAAPTTGAYSGRGTSRSPSHPQNGRRLRRRRSSLANTSPISAIKSPLINAGQALELQRHLHKSPLKARSSSVSFAAAADMMAGDGSKSINGENIFMARLRSGSVSSYR